LYNQLTGEQNGDEQQISCEASMLIIITTLVGALIRRCPQPTKAPLIAQRHAQGRDRGGE